MGRANHNAIIYTICGLVVLVIALRAIFSPPPPYAPQASEAELAAYARSTLERVQKQSIARNQEYCGVIIESDEGELSTSNIYAGGPAECGYIRMRDVGHHVIASFHTHGGVDPAYDSEYPSIEDVEGSMAERMAGFIGTPGGRIWQVDWRSGTASQLCGAGCIEQDERYASLQEEEPRERYSLVDLRGRASPTDAAL